MTSCTDLISQMQQVVDAHYRITRVHKKPDRLFLMGKLLHVLINTKGCYMGASKLLLLCLLINICQQIHGDEFIPRDDNKINSRSFAIDYDSNTFLLDGKPFSYISGGMHYYRVPFFYWTDRLQKLAAAGMDAVQTYVAWNVHEPKPGQYNFQGQNDLPGFLQAAQEAGLLVILRAGPYICAEWDYGGLPGWLLADNETMTVRKMDQKYIAAVDRWFSVLLPKIQPYLYVNGGPVIMVQVENEYGSYAGVACDHDYMNHLTTIFRQHLGPDALLFTTDGNDMSYLRCGATPNAYATVDFGPTSDLNKSFAAMRQWNPKGPLVNSECYTGWMDDWSGGHHSGSTSQLVQTLQGIRDMNASVNMYMFEGGTNFGYMNGADPTYTIVITSYDYDSPLTEAGDITDKYMAIRQMMSKYKQLPPVPQNTSKYAYGRIDMKSLGSIVSLLQVVSPLQPFQSLLPQNMEQANHFYGFVVYRHVFKKSYALSVLEATGIRDRGYVLIDGIPVGVLDRNSAKSFNTLALAGQTLDIVVENQGRINYGSQINDNKKGLVSNVTFGGEVLTNWNMYPIDLNNVFKMIEDRTLTFRSRSKLINFFHQPSPQLTNQPTIFTGEFVAPADIGARDTFLQMCGWFKGQALINGFNVGRYWPSQGPQVTLYIPTGVIRPAPASNVIVMFELEHSPSTSNRGSSDSIRLVDTPILNSRCFNSSNIESIVSSHSPKMFQRSLS